MSESWRACSRLCSWSSALSSESAPRLTRCSSSWCSSESDCRGSGDGDDPDASCRRPRAGSSSSARRAASRARRRRRCRARAPPGARQHDELAAAVDQHDARRHGGLGDERVGDALADGVELERAGEHRRQLLQAVELRELVGHAACAAGRSRSRARCGRRRRAARSPRTPRRRSSPRRASSIRPSDLSPTSRRAQATWRGE